MNPLLIAMLVVGADPTYWDDVRPLLRKHCTVCHQAKNLRELDVSGGIALDTLEAIQGSKKLTVGKSGASDLFKVLITTDAAKRMPLDAKPLKMEEIDLIKRWIDLGAVEGKKPADVAEVQPLSKPRTRKLDIVLATSATPPIDLAGVKTAGKIDVAWKVGPLAPITALAFSPDDQILAVGSYGLVALWDLKKAEPVRVLTNVLGAVHDLRYSPSGDLLAVGGGQPGGKGEVRFFSTKDYQLVATLRGHDDVVFSVAFRPDGKKIATASFDHTVRLWDVEKHAMEKEYHNHSDFVYGVAFSPDGSLLASASKDRTVQLFDPNTGKSKFTFSGLEQDIMTVAFSPDGKQIVSSGFEPGLYFWNPMTGEKIKQGGGHSIATHQVSFSKDGSKIVSGGADRLARTFDSAGVLRKSFTCGSSVYAVAIRGDGNLIAAGSHDGLVRLFDEASARHLATLLAIPGAKDADWLAATPEGFLACPDSMLPLARWKIAAQDASADKLLPILRRPELVRQAVSGAVIPGPFDAKKK